MIGTATGTKIRWLFETPREDGSFDFTRREITLVDPGFDVRDDEALEAWGRRASGGTKDEHWTVWRNVEHNLAGVTVFRHES